MDVNGALPVKRWNNKNGGFFVFTAIYYNYCVKETTVLQSAFMTENNIIHIHSIHLYLQKKNIYIIYTYNKYIEMHLCVCVYVYIYIIYIYIFCMSIHLSLPSFNRLSEISIPTQALLPWWKHVVSWRCHGDFLLEQFFSNHTLVFYDLLLFSLSITLLSFFPCDCWSSLLRIRDETVKDSWWVLIPL